MQIPNDPVLLRIFIGESDRWEHINRSTKPSCSRRANRTSPPQRCYVAPGFGKSSRLHTAKILRLSMPLVIEIVGSEEKINAFLPLLDTMIGGGLVTLEKVRVIDYRAGKEIPGSS